MRSNNAWWVVAALAASAACGSSNSDSTAGDPATTDVDPSDGPTPTTGAPDTSTTDAPTSTSEPAPATTVDETTSAQTTTTGGDTTDAIGTTAIADTTGDTDTTDGPDTTGEPDTTGDMDTTAGDASLTKIWYVDGFQYQLRIFHGDPATDVCSVVLLDNLVSGSDNPKYKAVEKPEGWGINSIFVYPGFDLCFDPYMFYVNNLMPAKSATGTITFNEIDPMTSLPLEMGIDIDAVYEQDEPWVPAAVELVAPAVPVTPG